MKIGYALAALDNYYKEGDARKEREYTQAKRDSELSTLGDKTESDRTGYQLRTGQNRANSELLPAQTTNAKKRLSLDQGELDGQAQRQPNEIKTKGINTEIGLANATNDQANLPSALEIKNNGINNQLLTSRAGLDNLPDQLAINKNKLKSELLTTDEGLNNLPTQFEINKNKLNSDLLTSDASLKQLPMKLQQAATQGVLDAQGQSDVVLGTMGQLISRNDKAGAISFANEIAKVGNILPNTNGKTFTDIIPVRKGDMGAQGDGYIFVTSDGTKRFTPIAAIQGAMGKLKNGEYQFLHTSDGSVYAGNKATGSITQAYKGDPKALRSQSSPADVQSAEWLMANVPKYKANPEAAWDAVRSSREKTRNSFVMDYVSKNALPGMDTNKLSEEAGRIYDALRSTQDTGGTPSNSGQRGTLNPGSYDPQINSLIGIP